MTQTTVHLINHTHWDREWFLTSVYTSRWIPGLIDKIEALAAANPAFKFLIDGQTLVVEDLLRVAPEYEAKIKPLIKQGQLIIGPYYCQPDWQLTGGETLVRNLLYGRQDMERYGQRNEVGWLVDTFGHSSQSPQLHRLLGLAAVYVWRGVPALEPYFNWQSSDGQSLPAINLFGGYRNLYGITHAPEVAITRLQAEVDKLAPYYPTPDIPLFDGYDLEEDPEDPMSFYQAELANLPPDIQLVESSPYEFAQVVREKVETKPIIRGELNSGKFGATFPGTFSARTYLKLMNHDCEQWLFRRAEPLAVLARLKGRTYHAAQYEAWARLMLQNTVHDCICGVSIDQVHEKMEYHYRAVFEGAREDVRRSLAYLLAGFAPGRYAVSTNPFPYQGWQVIDDRLYHIKTNGLGVWPLGAGDQPFEQPAAPVETWHWQNDHYTATVNRDGAVQIGEATLGRLVIYEETGDTYSDEAGTDRATLRPTGRLIIEQKSDKHSVVRYDIDTTWRDVRLTATVRLRFDPTSLIGWQIDLDSHGTNFKLDLIFETGQTGQIYAGMPFDVVERPAAETDLLPRQLDKTLAKVLLGQRELEAVKTFPFQDFVAISDGTAAAVVLAQGLRSYQADNSGTMALTLRRAVEWLTAANLDHRVGDAGPFFYVPDARCERSVRHEVGLVVNAPPPDDMALQQLNAAFQNPPLIVESQGQGRQTEWAWLQEPLPLSSLTVAGDHLLARFYNPTPAAQPLSRAYLATDVLGQPQATLSQVPAKRIVTVRLAETLPATGDAPPAPPVSGLAWPAWRIGDNHGRPDPDIIARLAENIAALEQKLAGVEAALAQAAGRDRYRLEHQTYVIKREIGEYQLSVRLNQLKLAAGNELSEDYLFAPDADIARIGLQLNRLRIKRRIFDYVIEAV
ncbi:MAG: hypothetical protein H6631_06305 [Anaerolineaceae bacterium]|nr:hypothetical protein [Anaerolineaceae bacterium]